MQSYSAVQGYLGLLCMNSGPGTLRPGVPEEQGQVFIFTQLSPNTYMSKAVL